MTNGLKVILDNMFTLSRRGHDHGGSQVIIIMDNCGIIVPHQIHTLCDMDGNMDCMWQHIFHVVVILDRSNV
jgi:hypothetical protein